LSGILQVHVKRGLTYVYALLQAVIARLADGSWFGAFSMVLAESADHGSVGHFGMRSKKLRLELLQKGFALLLKDVCVGHRLGHGLRFRDYRNNTRRNSLCVLAGGAGIQVSGIVERALGARETITGRLVNRPGRCGGRDSFRGSQMIPHVNFRLR
jgi:hypothetical protein